MSRYHVIGGVLGVVSTLAGGVGGYFLAKKKLAAEYQEALEAEIIKTKKFYALVHKDGVTLPEATKEELEVLKEVKPVLDRYAGRKEQIQYHQPVEKPATDLVNNIFNNGVAEIAPPELVTEAEYIENGPEYTQVTYTYYQGDGVVADQSDEVITEEDVKNQLGPDSLEHFGEGDWDPNLLYVMNRRLEHMYEINLSTGSYRVEVLGLET